MKKVIALLFAACLLLPACISFTIRPPDLPENLLEEIILCKSVDASQDQWRPQDISLSFSLDDGSVACLVKIRYVEQEIRLRWRWYSPQGAVAKDTGEVAVNSDSRYLDEVTAYDTFRFQPEIESLGTWTVTFFINDALAGKRDFSIREEDESEPKIMRPHLKGKTHDFTK